MEPERPCYSQMPIEVNPSAFTSRDQVGLAIAIPIQRFDEMVVVPGQIQRDVGLGLDGPALRRTVETIPAQSVEVFDGVTRKNVQLAVSIPVHRREGSAA